jgi:hypothetical protein
MKKNKIELFEVGKYYRHKDGTCIAIRSMVNTTQWGECLIAECNTDSWGLMPLNPKPTGPDDWEEVSEEVWSSVFEKQ